MNTRSFLFCASVIMGFVLGAAPSQAQSVSAANTDALEEIIVTAQKRDEVLQDVPMSVVAFSGDKISDMNLGKIDELQMYVPNLTVTETGIGTMLLMRGIGSGVNQGFEQSVGTYVDGIYRGRAQQSRMPFLDVERIEVLRGPQSILFGKDSVAGALNITTAKPATILRAEITGLYEPVANDRIVSGYLSGPLSERFKGRLAFHGRDKDGWMENLTLGRDEAQRQERALRGTLGWNVSEDFDLSLKAESSHFDVEGREIEIVQDKTAVAGPFAGLNYGAILQVFGQHPSVRNSELDFKRSSNGDFSYNDTDELVLTANYHGWGDNTLTSITGYSTYQYEERCDCDFTGADVFSAAFTEDFDQFSQEFRLTSPAGAAFDYLLGLSYYTNSLEFFDSIAITSTSVLLPIVDRILGPGAGKMIANTATPRRVVQDSDSQALFAQGTWNYNDHSRLTLGFRLASEDKTGARQLTITKINFEPLADAVKPYVLGIYAGLFNVRNHQLNGERGKTYFLPSLNYQYEFNDALLSYVSYTIGEKAGGFDARSNNAPQNGGAFEFDDEEAKNYEIGAKYSFADGTAELNAALYYTEFDQMQVSTYDGVLGFNVGNAARAEAKGLELDGRWQMTNSLRLSGSLALSDFQFREFNGQCYFGQAADAPDGINCDYSGKTNQYLPDRSATITADYSRALSENLNVNVVLDLIHESSYFLTATLDPDAVQDAYHQLNGMVAIGPANRSWKLALIGKNLTDKKIMKHAGEVPLAGSRFGTPGFFALVEPPRTIALQVRFNY